MDTRFIRRVWCDTMSFAPMVDDKKLGYDLKAQRGQYQTRLFIHAYGTEWRGNFVKSW